jgi:hypothetical protein
MIVHYGAIACSEQAVGSWQSILQMSATDTVLQPIDIVTNGTNKWLTSSKVSAADNSERK